MYSRRQVEIRAAREKSLEASKLKDWSGIARTLKHDCKIKEELIRLTHGSWRSLTVEHISLLCQDGMTFFNFIP